MVHRHLGSIKPRCRYCLACCIQRIDFVRLGVFLPNGLRVHVECITIVDEVARTGEVLARLILLDLQIARKPLLCVRDGVQALGTLRDDSKTVAARSLADEHDAKFLNTLSDFLAVEVVRVFDAIDVKHEESARLSLLVEPTPIKGRLPGDDGQALLDFVLQFVIAICFCYLAAVVSHLLGVGHFQVLFVGAVGSALSANAVKNCESSHVFLVILVIFRIAFHLSK